MLKYARTLQGAKAMQNIISKIIAFSKQLATDTKERTQIDALEDIRQEIKTDFEAFKRGELEAEPLGKDWEYI